MYFSVKVFTPFSYGAQSSWHMFFFLRLFSDGKGKVIWKSSLIQRSLKCRIIAWHHMKVISRWACSVNVKNQVGIKEKAKQK